MKNLAIILAVAALFIGCAAQKTVYVPVDGQHKIEYRDSIIHITDTIKVEIPKEKIVEVVPQLDTSRLETKLAISTAFLDTTKRTINHTLEHKPTALKQAIDTVIVVQTKTEYLEKPTIVEVETPVPYIPKGFWWLLGWAIFTLGIIIFRVWSKFA